MPETGPIGFIGLGNMGVPMVRNLAKAGFAVVGFDTRPEARAALDDIAGAAAVADIADIATTCRTVILMLPDSAVVNRVVLGGDPPAVRDIDPDDATLAVAEDGLAARMAAASAGSHDHAPTIIDMSSSFPLSTRALGQTLSDHGIVLIDAPVSGGVVKAVSGELAIMAGGPENALIALNPVLAAMGRVFATGDLGSGHATKALNNYLSASSLIATAEAVLIGEKFGLDAKRMNAVFNASTGKSNTTENKVDRYFLTETYNSGFALALLDKDVGMARELAAGLGIDGEMLARVSNMLSTANGELTAAADHTEMHRWLKSRIGGERGSQVRHDVAPAPAQRNAGAAPDHS